MRDCNDKTRMASSCRSDSGVVAAVLVLLLGPGAAYTLRSDGWASGSKVRHSMSAMHTPSKDIDMSTCKPHHGRSSKFPCMHARHGCVHGHGHANVLGCSAVCSTHIFVRVGGSSLDERYEGGSVMELWFEGAAPTQHAVH